MEVKMKKQDNKRFIQIVIVTVIVIGIGLILSFANDKTPNNNNNKNNNNNNNNSQNEEEIDVYNNVDLKELAEVFKSNELSLIYIARPTCGHCQEFSPILEKATKEYDLTINYINIDTLTTNEQQEEYMSIHGFLKSSGFSTPTLLAVKQGGIFDLIIGAVDEGTLKEFLIKNDFIKEK
jgi:predicted bacteriocin transport accessory protein